VTRYRRNVTELAAALNTTCVQVVSRTLGGPTFDTGVFRQTTDGTTVFVPGAHIRPVAGRIVRFRHDTSSSGPIVGSVQVE